MNKQECDILEALHAEPYINQRVLSDLSGHSLGIVNRSLRQLLKEGYIDDNIRLTKKAENEFADKAPKQAIILAAGFGMRMVPINLESPKAFLQVNGEYLIERLIRQLHEVGIKKIKFVACAICCSIPQKNVKRKMRIVPPPIPVPLTIPEITPITISNIFLSPFCF